MDTQAYKSKIDKIWDTIWTGGITSPSAALEQITYLLFMKLLDEEDTSKAATASALGIPYQSNIFKQGEFKLDPDDDASIPYENLRWSNFHNYEPTEMFFTVKDWVFPFIKTVNGEAQDTAFARFMNDAVFLIPTPKVLAVCVDTLDELEVSNKDVMGDVYEYCLNKMASAGTLGQFRTPRHIIAMMVELMKPTVTDTILEIKTRYLIQNTAA